MSASIVALQPLSLIISVGPNPALQRVLRFDAPVAAGGVHRAASLTQYVGGKGQGMALALQRWSPSESHACASFLGGDTGTFCEASLRAAGLDLITQHVSAPTRICTTLLAPASAGAAPVATELIDPSGAVSEAEVEALASAVLARAPAAAAIALCGTMPPGAHTLYELLAKGLAILAEVPTPPPPPTTPYPPPTPPRPPLDPTPTPSLPRTPTPSLPLPCPFPAPFLTPPTAPALPPPPPPPFGNPLPPPRLRALSSVSMDTSRWRVSSRQDVSTCLSSTLTSSPTSRERLTCLVRRASSSKGWRRRCAALGRSSLSPTARAMRCSTVPPPPGGSACPELRR